MVQQDGTIVGRSRGTPQGGVVSPILANLFMHYAFDVWMVRTHPGLPWCRYADDGLVHCRNQQEAQALTPARWLAGESCTQRFQHSAQCGWANACTDAQPLAGGQYQFQS
jgi:hypothetical protein